MIGAYCIASRASFQCHAIPFETQDLRIADLAEREGRAVVVAVNKWDIEDEKQDKLRDLREAFERLLPQLRGAPLITVSARTGRGLDRLQAAIMRAYEVWNRRIPTAQLNRWWAGMVEMHPPPAPAGRRIKLRYMTQAKSRPPGFVVMISLMKFASGVTQLCVIIRSVLTVMV